MTAWGGWNQGEGALLHLVLAESTVEATIPGPSASENMLLSGIATGPVKRYLLVSTWACSVGNSMFIEFPWTLPPVGRYDRRFTTSNAGRGSADRYRDNSWRRRVQSVNS
jgi:hypothetical protein